MAKNDINKENIEETSPEENKPAEVKVKRKKQLFLELAVLLALPLFVLGVVLVFVGNKSVNMGMELEIRERLAATARETADLYRAAYPGEIKMQDGMLTMGETELTGNTMLAERTKENTGTDISIIYDKQRILTTLPSDDGGHLTGTYIENDIVYDAIMGGNEYYSSISSIDGNKYYTYYVPLKNGDKVVAVLEAAMPNNQVRTGAATISVKIVLVFIIAFLVILLLSSAYIKNLVDRLTLIKNFIGELADNRVDSKMPEKVLKKNDEIAAIGDYAIVVGKKVRQLIFHDPLTGLYNRRAGMMELSKYMELADIKERSHVTLALGDIDHFKRVNDTFGHDAGDAVLVECSRLFKEYTTKNAFSVRWGGEEFLLVFNDTLENALVILEALLDEVRETVIEHEGTTLSVTMTFGVTEYEKGMTIDQLVKKADDLLYEGKEGGRNQIVTEK